MADCDEEEDERRNSAVIIGMHRHEVLPEGINVKLKSLKFLLQMKKNITLTHVWHLHFAPVTQHNYQL